MTTNGQDYFFQVPILPQISDNQRTKRVGINNSNPQYDLDVNGTINATDLIIQSNANIYDITTDLIVSSNAVFISAYASNLDVVNLSLQETPIGNTASNPLIDYSFLKDHGLSNEVWIEHWKKFCGLGGALVGGVYAYTGSLAVWDNPLTSPHGITAFDASEAVAGVNGAEGYGYALETLNPLAQFLSSVQGAHLGKSVGEDSFSASILNMEDTALSNAGFQTIDVPFTILGCNLDIPITSDFDINTLNELTCVDAGAGAALTSMDADAYLPVQGWITKITPLMQGLGTLAGTAFGCKVQVALNKGVLEDHSAQLETLTTDVSGLDETVTGHTADLATLDTSVTTLTTDVAAIDASVAALDIAVTDIETTLSSTTTTAENALSTATYASNALPSYLPLSGGVMTGSLTAYSNINMATPFMLSASNGSQAGNLFIDPSYLRYTNNSGIQFSVNSNAMFPLSTPYTRICGQMETNIGGYSNFARLDASFVNGFTYGMNLSNTAPNGFDIFNVSVNGEISTFAKDVGYMSKITNSNAEVTMGGFTMKKDGSVNDASGYVLFDTGGSLRRKGSNVGGSMGFTVSPTGYVSAGTGLTIDPYGNLVCSNITASNILCSNLANPTGFMMSNSNVYTLCNAVGIGMSNPAYKLDVFGALRLYGSNNTTTANSPHFYAYTTDVGLSHPVLAIQSFSKDNINFYFDSHYTGNDVYSETSVVPYKFLKGNGKFTMYSAPKGTQGSTISAWTTNLCLNSNGYVGIGSTTPASPLDVTGNGNFTSISVGNLTINGNGIFVGSTQILSTATATINSSCLDWSSGDEMRSVDFHLPGATYSGDPLLY